MPVPVLVATPGASNANSYLTVAEADALFDAHVYPGAWATSTTDQKTVALIHATTLLDAMVEWTGTKATEDQALQWPRTGMLDRSEDYAIDDDVIPQDLKRATAELAKTLRTSDRTLDSDLETLGISRVKAGSVEVDFSNPRAKVIADAIYYLLPEHWGVIRKRGSGNVKLLRA